MNDFFGSIKLAGADLSGTDIESHVRTLERSRKMLSIVDNAVDLLRAKHKKGEHYWILYYAYLSPKQIVLWEFTTKDMQSIAEHFLPGGH